MEIKIRKVAIIGTGTLGTQIAIHSSFHGYEVSAYDPDEKAFQKVLEMIRVRVANSNREPTLSLEEIQNQAKKIRWGKSLEKAVRGADLIIEAIPEDLALKQMIFKQMEKFAPEKAILATNSPQSLYPGLRTRPSVPKNALTCISIPST